MSETSEKMGRCFSEVHECRGSPSELKIADAIDRLAADVEAIKAKVDAVSPEDVKHFVDSEKAWVALVTEQRDAAIRERDTAMAEVERLKAELAARQADGNRQATLDSSPAAPQPAAPAAGWLTAEEREILAAHARSLRDESSFGELAGMLGYIASPGVPERKASIIDAILSRAGSPPEQAAAGWLTDEERGALSRAFDLLCDDDGDNPLAGTVQALLSRAGSPPVVEVPPMGFAVYGFDSPFSIGEYRAGYREACLAHRDALDKAGVAWKEVGRE